MFNFSPISETNRQSTPSKKEEITMLDGKDEEDVLSEDDKENSVSFLFCFSVYWRV